MNRGIELASGEWIGILNSDDYYLPGALEKVLAAASPEVDVIHGDMILLEEEFQLALRCRKLPGISQFRQQPAFHPTMFVRRSVYEQIGKYDQGLVLASDWEFMIRAREAGKNFVRLDDALTVMRMGGTSEGAHFRVPTEMLQFFLRHGASFQDYCWWLKYCLTRSGQWLSSFRRSGADAMASKLRSAGFTDFESTFSSGPHEKSSTHQM